MLVMNETIRDYIKRRVRWCLAVAVLGWLSITLTASLWNGQGQSGVRVFGFLVFLGAIICLQWFVRCPKCEARIGRTIALPVGFSSGSGRKINFCPYCGIGLDEPRL
jgi:hypothetical protein